MQMRASASTQDPSGLFQQRSQRLHLRHRRLADEIAADIGRRLAIHQIPVGEQWHGWPIGQHLVRPEAGRHRSQQGVE
jgi:hypothetical protein